jgi:hypothetical protein
VIGVRCGFYYLIFLVAGFLAQTVDYSLYLVMTCFLGFLLFVRSSKSGDLGFRGVK